MNNPPGIGSWSITTKITYIQFRSDALLVDFDKRTGSGRWPNFPFDPGGAPDPSGGGIQYTLGMCFDMSGHWYCSAAIQFWHGPRSRGGRRAVEYSAERGHYDSRWSPMNGYLPAQGETVGIFVVAGNVRNVHDGTQMVLHERSNITLVPIRSREWVHLHVRERDGAVPAIATDN